MPSASGWGGFRRIEFRRRAAPSPRWRGWASGDHCPPHRPEPRLSASSQTARWPPKAAGPFLGEEPANGRRAPLAKGRAPGWPSLRGELLRCGRIRTRPRRGSVPRDSWILSEGQARTGRARPDGLQSRFRRPDRVPSLPWCPRFPGGRKNACKSLRRHVPKATPDPGSCSGFSGLRCQIAAPRIRGPCPTPRNQLVSPRLTPLGDSQPRRLESRFPGGILLGRLLRFRSIPWPPAPTGKASCAFRS